MFTPANLVRPEVAVADVEVDEWVADVADFEVEVTRVLLDLAVPGRHCEYHGLEYVQTYPLIQVVAPVQFSPPPKCLANADSSWLAELTLSPSTTLSQGSGCQGSRSEKNILQTHFEY